MNDQEISAMLDEIAYYYRMKYPRPMLIELVKRHFEKHKKKAYIDSLKDKI